jgi:hypothetical protein
MRRRLVALGVVLPAIILLLNLYPAASPDLAERFFASLLIVLSAIPTAVWLCGDDPNTAFVPLVGLLYAVYYAVPVFVLNNFVQFSNSGGVVSDHAMAGALALSCAGITAMLLGYYNPLTHGLRRLIPRIRFGWSDLDAVRNTGIILCIFGIIVRVVLFRYMVFGGANPGVAPGLQQVLVHLTDMPMVGAAMLCCLQFSAGLPPATTVLLWLVFVPLLVVLGLATGALSPGLQVGLMLLLVYSTVRRRFPWTLIALGFAATCILVPVRTRYRVFLGGLGVGSPISRARLLWQTFGDTRDSSRVAIEATMDRLNQSATLAVVMEFTPAVVPFWKGHSYRPLFSKLVPRMIYPSKPQEDVGQLFPHRYGLLPPWDGTTAYKLPQLIEAYVNFGIVGVIGVMFAIGVVYQLFQALLVHPQMGIGEIVAATFILLGWTDIEANLSLVFGGFVFSFVFIGLIGAVVNAVRLAGEGRRAGALSRGHAAV